MPKATTVQQFMALFPDDDACLEHLFKTRFGETVQCPKCGKVSKFHRLSNAPAYSCQWCAHHIHPMVGTLFAKSHTSLQLWYHAMYLFTTTRHGVSAKELQRQLGVSYETAWRMGHEIRKYMAALDGQGPLDGNVEADETYVGGKRKGKRGRGAAGKTVVFAMQDRDGALISKVVPDAKGATLKPEIEMHVAKGSTVHTDEFGAYSGLDRKGYKHKTVNHSAGEYARDGSHVNTVEGWFSILKRSIRSTHVWVSRKHLPNYLREFEFRHNLRKHPELMFQRMLAFRAS
jgi:transposase-like protein